MDNDNKKDEIVNIVNLSKNVINCELLLKKLSEGTLQSFQKKNMIMSGLNTETLLMLLKFQTAMMQ